MAPDMELWQTTIPELGTEIRIEIPRVNATGLLEALRFGHRPSDFAEGRRVLAPMRRASQPLKFTSTWMCATGLGQYGGKVVPLEEQTTVSSENLNAI